jgi:hypothetical protein
MNTERGVRQACRLVAVMCDFAYIEMSRQHGVTQADFEWLEGKQYYAKQVAKLVLELDDAKLVDNLKCNIEEDIQSLVQVLADMDVHVEFS